jgi:hypothetical protein
MRFYMRGQLPWDVLTTRRSVAPGSPDTSSIFVSGYPAAVDAGVAWRS